MPSTAHLTRMFCLPGIASFRALAVHLLFPGNINVSTSIVSNNDVYIPMMTEYYRLQWQIVGKFILLAINYFNIYCQKKFKTRLILLIIIAIIFVDIIDINKAMSEENVWDNFYTACNKDIRSYCGSMAPQGSHLIQCLADYRSALSTNCQQVITNLSSERVRARIQMQCHSDADRFCPGLTPEDRRLADCMRAHIDELSEGCKSAAPIHLIAAACRSDVAAFCQHGTRRDLILRICLLDHVPDLSPACINAIPSPAKAERLSNYSPL